MRAPHLRLVSASVTPLPQHGSTASREPAVAAAKGTHTNACYALSIKRLYGPHIVKAAAKHNLREIAAEIGCDGHIDAARIPDNFSLRGPATAEEVACLARTLMGSAGIAKLRKTAVMALELLFTLPATTNIDPSKYFEDATLWAETYFKVPVLSSVVHLDESAPHCHVLLLPLVNSKMNGSDLHGGKAKLSAMQAAFHEKVAAGYGFSRQAPQKRHSVAVRAAAMQLAFERLQTKSGLADSVIEAILKPHAKNPEPLLTALNIVMPKPTVRTKSFVEIMTRPVSPRDAAI